MTTRNRVGGALARRRLPQAGGLCPLNTGHSRPKSPGPPQDTLFGLQIRPRFCRRKKIPKYRSKGNISPDLTRIVRSDTCGWRCLSPVDVDFEDVGPAGARRADMGEDLSQGL